MRQNQFAFNHGVVFELGDAFADHLVIAIQVPKTVNSKAEDQVSYCGRHQTANNGCAQTEPSHRVPSHCGPDA